MDSEIRIGKPWEDPRGPGGHPWAVTIRTTTVHGTTVAIRRFRTEKEAKNAVATRDFSAAK